MTYKISIYETSSGECPFNNWLRRLDKAASARIDARLVRFEKGLLSDCKKLKGVDIYEARFDFGPGYRLYFGIFRKDLILLVLLGGDKKSQHSDIAKAQSLWQRYLEEKYGSNT